MGATDVVLTLEAQLTFAPRVEGLEGSPEILQRRWRQSLFCTNTLWLVFRAQKLEPATQIVSCDSVYFWIVQVVNQLIEAPLVNLGRAGTEGVGLLRQQEPLNGFTELHIDLLEVDSQQGQTDCL